VSNIGDGIAVAAGPLLMASVTRDPMLVAAAAMLQRLPWVFFGLYAGVLADRLDRVRMVVAVDLARAVVLLAFTLVLLGESVPVWVVLAVMFLLGTAETFADTASPTLLPMIVDPPDLGIANARLMAGYLTMNQLVAPPIGAALFALGIALPFGTQAVCVAFGALLIGRMQVPAMPARLEPSHVRRDIVEGFRWLWGNGPVRTLALTILVFNVTWGAAWSVLVLLAQDRLGMGPVGFGALTTAVAVGGLGSTAAYDWLEQRFTLATLMRACLLTETLVHLGLAVTTSPAVALSVMFAFGAEAFVWGSTARAVRQRAVPTEFQGRVGSVYTLGLMGGLVIGQVLGGVHASVWGGDGTVLVRVRRLGDAVGDHLARTRPDRPRRRLTAPAGRHLVDGTCWTAPAGRHLVDATCCAAPDCPPSASLRIAH